MHGNIHHVSSTKHLIGSIWNIHPFIRFIILKKKNAPNGIMTESLRNFLHQQMHSNLTFKTKINNLKHFKMIMQHEWSDLTNIFCSKSYIIVKIHVNASVGDLENEWTQTSHQNHKTLCIKGSSLTRRYETWNIIEAKGWELCKAWGVFVILFPCSLLTCSKVEYLAHC